ncbi:MAG TPA: thiamine pyrophosphate-binding protein [Thermoanaerobaculia bacterium]|nr:thiamine pyrophosphate-binding protein [Thermoanaerobaculia bacterium]
MKGSDYIALFLESRGVGAVFEMSGGMITHMLDSIHQRTKIRIVSVHHEQAAAFAAEGYGRITGIPGVAMATSGPGATNLLTGIGSCHFDSSPAVFITGQVNRHEQKGDRAVRQLGFQETDIVSMAKPITKASWLVRKPEELPEMLERSFELAVSGRPGPVLLDVPMDIQREDLKVEAPFPLSLIARRPEVDADLLKRLFAAITEAKRPLILAGGGIRSSRSTELFRRFAAKTKIPVVNSLMAVDALASDDPLRVGMIGSYGNRWANLAIAQSDLLIVLGSRLDIRQTGSETKAFRGQRTIFHIDCESGEMNNRITDCIEVHSELGDFFEAAIEASGNESFHERTEWVRDIAALRMEWPDTSEIKNLKGINPNQFMHDLSRVSSAAAAFVVDVGQHQMWAAQSLDLHSDQRFLTSGGMGSMGFALPASIGVAVATSPRPVVVVAGDGGFQSNIQELQTVFRNQLPLKIVVIDNGCHGMVRQFQESYFEARYQSTLWGYSAPKFTAVSEAYGIPASTITDQEQVAEALAWLWSDPVRPALLQVMVDTYTNAYPKIAFGRPNTEMEPFATPIGMEST